ncbi:MAG TPA: RNA-binding domain-containing protein [Vicinamibacterales bacterium]|nr:RNA-binding domain-containing protein [Vicinamibacterales bacterium]
MTTQAHHYRITDQELPEAIQAGERPGVEFKNARGRQDASFWEVARAALGKANRPDGGLIIIGVDDNGNAPGLSETHATTWMNADHVRQALAPYADPFVWVDTEVRTVAAGPLANRRFAVISVREFDQLPVPTTVTGYTSEHSRASPHG